MGGLIHRVRRSYHALFLFDAYGNLRMWAVSPDTCSLSWDVNFEGSRYDGQRDIGDAHPERGV